MPIEYVCECGHPRRAHVSGGGCKWCVTTFCDCYDQTGLRIAGETDKQYAARKLKLAKRSHHKIKKVRR